MDRASVDRRLAAVELRQSPHEERAKEIIREEYKEYHIGYLPVVLSHQVVPKLGEYERTMTAVLDTCNRSHADRDCRPTAAHARLATGHAS